MEDDFLLELLQSGNIGALSDQILADARTGFNNPGAITEAGETFGSGRNTGPLPSTRGFGRAINPELRNLPSFGRKTPESLGGVSNPFSDLPNKGTDQLAGLFGEKPGQGDSRRNNGNTLATASKFAIPVARLISNELKLGKLRDEARVDLGRIDLNTGTVVDIPRPNFALPGRTPGGSSLLEQQAGQKFADSAQRTAEAEFENLNATSRIQQEEQIRQAENREAIINNQIGNQEELANSNLAAQELFFRLEDQQGTLESVFANLDQEIFNRQVLGTANQVSTAKFIIQFPDKFSPEQVEAAKRMLSGVIAEKGGKLGKTKFSHG